MILHTLRLHSFRAHADTSLSLAPKINLLHGPNGAGKTNVLEAIHYLCLSKSFLTAQDAFALREGTPYFEVEGSFEGERRPSLVARLVFVPGEGKRVFLNRVPLERLSDLVGVLPVVLFAPVDQALTAEGPEERRRFLNSTLSQAHPVYLDDLLKYRRALQQRNALLFDLRRWRGGRDELLASWDAELVSLGSRLIQSRRRFIAEFTGYLRAAYERIEAVGEEPTIEYATVARLPEDAPIEEIATRFERKLRELAPREREQGRTLVGPHRDELVFRLNGMEVRRYASRGQHRTFGMALKLATHFYLRENLNEHPILLLDDVFGDLDPRRTEIFLTLLASDAVGQSVITAADDAVIRRTVPFDRPEHRALRVEEGRVIGEE